MLYYIIYGLIFLGGGYFVLIFIFDLLLRGFAPFIPSRPWVVQQLFGEFELKEENSVLVAFSSGRSGFFRFLEKKYPHYVLVGVEPSLFPFLVSKIQSWIRRTRIKVVHQPVNRADVSKADLIYNHLYPNDMKDLGKKLKFECRPGTIVISTGFNIPGLEPRKIIDLPDLPGRLEFLSKNQKLFQKKSRKYKKEKKAYFYEI